MSARVLEWKAKHAGEITKAWDELLRAPWGRQLLFEVLDAVCFVDASAYERARAPDGSVDMNEFVRLTGMQDAGKVLRARAQAENPEMYWRMVAEAMSARRMLLIAQKADADAAAATS